jgi:hypothetical protein
MKEIFETWVSDFSGHGLGNIFRAKYTVIRIVWIVCYFACFGYTVYSVTKSIRRFYKYEVAIETEIVREQPTDFPAVTVCNLNPFNEVRAFQKMADVARTFPETQICSKRKTQIIQAMTVTLANQFEMLGLIDKNICSDSPSSCTFYDWTAVYNEMLSVFTKFNWTIIQGKQNNLTVLQALVLLNTSSDNWLKFSANSSWSNMSLSDWFHIFAIDDDVLMNPAVGLNQCLQLLSSDDVNSLINKLKRTFANQYKSASLSDFNKLGFDLNLDMLQSCTFNGQSCVANYTLNNDCKYFSSNCSSVTYGANNRFTPFWHNQYGMCYTFNDGKNTGPIVKTGQSGQLYGLRLSIISGT